MGSRQQTDLQYQDKTKQALSKLPDYVKTYIRAIHYTAAPRTCYEYVKDIAQYMQWVESITHTPITLDILAAQTRQDFEEYLEHLEHYVSPSGQQRTNSRTSLKRKVASLRKFFAWLFSEEYIPSDETRKLQLPKIAKKEIIYLDNQEITTLLDNVETGSQLTGKQIAHHKRQSIRDMAIITLMLSTGIRVSECTELDVQDIDMNNKCIHITRKGGTQTSVYFSDEIVPYLQAYYDNRINRQDVPSTEKAFFLSSRKTRCNQRTIEILVQKYALSAIPGKHITPHKLRSTFATQLYQTTGDIYLVAETLGHHDVTTTKNHYAQITDTRKRDNRNKVQLFAQKPDEKEST